MVEQQGANERRRAELDAAAGLATAQGEASTSGVLAAAEAERDRSLAAARADGVRLVGLAEGEAEAARLAAYRDLPPAVLHGLALRELAGQLPSIGQLTVTPDVVTGTLARLTSP